MAKDYVLRYTNLVILSVTRKIVTNQNCGDEEIQSSLNACYHEVHKLSFVFLTPYTMDHSRR
jgi:hypothetical protein